MICNTFIHNDPDVFHGKELTLHDCVANRISFNDGILRFYFPDGFWVTSHHQDNCTGKVLRTDASVVDFAVECIDDITARIFIDNTRSLFKKSTVEYWHIEQIIAAVNSDKCVIEFVTQYRAYYEQMWHCTIRSNKKPYFRECQLYLPNTTATFHWNNLCQDREW